MIPVSQAMLTRVEPLAASRTIEEALQILRDSRLPGIPVVNRNAKLMGVLFRDSLLGEIPPQTPLVK